MNSVVFADSPVQNCSLNYSDRCLLENCLLNWVVTDCKNFHGDWFLIVPGCLSWNTVW